MKTVFTSHEISHVWASQSQSHGRCPGNLSFDGPTIKSYSTDIGRIISPGEAVILNETSYSVTTSKSQGRVRAAVSHFPIKFYVDGLSRGSVLYGFDGRKLHDYYTRAAAQCIADSQKPRIRQATRDSFLAQAGSHLDSANRATEYFKLRRAKIARDDLESVAKRIRTQDAREAAALQKAADEKQKRFKLEQERRDALLAEHSPALTKLWREHQEKSEGAQYLLDVLRAAHIHGSECFVFGESADGFEANALLRLSEDRTRVETSQGAQTLVRTVRFLWEYCAHARANGRAVPAEIVQRFPRLDHYLCNSIDASGNLVAGCHRIAFAEVENIARELGLPPFNGQLLEPATLPANEEVTS